MKKCSDCNIEMKEKTNLHTDYVGGAMFETQVFLDYEDEEYGKTSILGNTKVARVKARVCPKCGKVELFVDTNE